MRFLIIFLFTAISTDIFGQTEKTRGDIFHLKGQVINEVEPTSFCGTFAFATVIEFQIIHFSDTHYKSDYIGVIVTCPELYGQNFFQTGEVYDLVIANENQADFNWLIRNKSKLSKYHLNKDLWVINAQKSRIIER